MAETLANRGIVVAGYDLRGHGHSGSDPECASFGEGGWEASVRDMHLFYQELSDDTSWLPDFTQNQPFSNKLAKTVWHC